jgi:exosortase/archaeosortase family protein
LRVLGFSAVAEGNLLLVGDHRLEVVEACSGLGTLVVFFALSTGYALLANRPCFDRVVLLVSAQPVALAANVARVVVTAVLQETTGDPGWAERYHEWAGWFMMLLALGVLRLELWLLDRVFEAENNPSPHCCPEAREGERTETLPSSLRAGRTPRSGERGYGGGFGFPVACLALVVAPAVVHGVWSERWGQSEAMRQAVARLERVPMDAGDWKGEPMPLSPRHRAIAEIRGYLLRRYRRSPREQGLSVLLLCGRPGPVSVHTPDVCYRGAGYQMVGEPEAVWVDLGADGEAWFWVADFRQRNVPAPRTLRIFWSWHDREWEAAEQPRLAHAGLPVLWKLYVIRELTRPGEPVQSDPALAFLRQWLSVLDRALWERDP